MVKPNTHSYIPVGFFQNYICLI